MKAKTITTPQKSDISSLCCTKDSNFKKLTISSTGSCLPEYLDIGCLKLIDLYNDAIRRKLIEGNWNNMFHYIFPQREAHMNIICKDID